MKGSKLIMGIFWILIAVILLGIFGWAMKRRGKESNQFALNFSSGFACSLFDTKTFSKDEIESIDIDLSSESVVVEKSLDDKITVEFYCTENTLPKTEVIQKVLKIDQDHIKGINFVGARKTVVKLPEGFSPKDFDLNLSSGSIKISNLISANLDVTASSGSIKINDSKIDVMDLRTHSGSVKISNCEMDTAECNVTSGSINLNGKYKKLDLKTTSGSIIANLEKALTMDSELKTTSGSINATLPTDSNLNINYSVTSGSYKNASTGNSGKKGTDRMGDGSVRLDLKTTSGSIRIN